MTPSSSVPAHTSDQPLQQQNESRPILTATPAPQQNAMSRSPTNTIRNTNQVPETLPFRSLCSTLSNNPDGQTIQELQQTERVYARQILNKLATMVGFEPTTVPQAIDTEKDIVSVLSPPLISNSASVGLEPEETSVVHNSTSPRRLFASVTAPQPRRLTRDPDEIGGSRSGGSIGNIPRTSLPEPEETSVTQPICGIAAAEICAAAEVRAKKAAAEICAKIAKAEICAKMPKRKFVPKMPQRKFVPLKSLLLLLSL